MFQVLALLQSATPPDQRLYIILGVVTLATLVVLGLKFFANMFEVITAPTASLKHHGQSDNFFFSLMVAFLGGLIGTFVLLINQNALTSTFGKYATTVANDIALGNSNPTYRDIAANKAADILNNHFALYFADQLVFFPVVVVLLWLVIGLIIYGTARIFGGQATFADFMGSLAYPAFFLNIGLGCFALFIVNTLAAIVAKQTPNPDVLAIVGGVLLLYGAILYLIAMSQAADLTGGQVIGVLIVFLILVGGASYGGYYYAGPAFEQFALQITSFDPATQSNY